MKKGRHPAKGERPLFYQIIRHTLPVRRLRDDFNIIVEYRLPT